MFWNRTQTRNVRGIDEETMVELARALGWFSIAVGVAQLAAPRTLTRAMGMEEETEIVRAYGLREIAAGIGILSQKDPTPWLWGRVVGDVLDLATLAIGLDDRNPQRRRVGVAIGAVAVVTLVDVAAARLMGSRRTREWLADTIERFGGYEAPGRLADMADYHRTRDRARHAADYAADRTRHAAEAVAMGSRRAMERARSYLDPRH
jgi:hypothetical protein